MCVCSCGACGPAKARSHGGVWACKAGTNKAGRGSVYLFKCAAGTRIPLFIMDFEFETWCKDNELSSKVVSMLKKENMVSLKCLQLVKDVDICDLGLNKGDGILLMEAVKGLRPADDTHSVPGPTAASVPTDTLMGADT